MRLGRCDRPLPSPSQSHRPSRASHRFSRTALTWDEELASRAPTSPTVLLVRDLLHPGRVLPAHLLCQRGVRHAGRRGGAVPVPQTGRDPDHIAGANLIDGSTFTLDPADTRGDNEDLSDRMRVPSGASTGLESN